MHITFSYVIFSSVCFHLLQKSPETRLPGKIVSNVAHKSHSHDLAVNDLFAPSGFLFDDSESRTEEEFAFTFSSKSPQPKESEGTGDAFPFSFSFGKF